MRYQAYGLVLSSDLLLPELEAAADLQRSSDLSIVRSGTRSGNRWRWIQPPPAAEEEPWIAIGASGCRHRVLFDTGAEFVLDAERRQIDVVPGAAPEAAIRHRLIDQVIPLSIAHRGGFVLHASAVLMPPGHAVAFVGPSGAGKSTLAASLARSGTDVLTDDALVIEHHGDTLEAIPSYPGVRIRPDVLPVLGQAAGDSQDGKRLASRPDGVPFWPLRTTLKRIYVLRAEVRGDVRIQPLPPGETIMALVAHAFVLDVSDKRRVAAHFARVAEASAFAEVRLLAYPHRLDALPAVQAAVAADLAAP